MFTLFLYANASEYFKRKTRTLQVDLISNGQLGCFQVGQMTQDPSCITYDLYCVVEAT